MSEQRFKPSDPNVPIPNYLAIIWDSEKCKHMSQDDVVVCLNEQQATINKQEEIIKSQDMEISRQYNLCLAMSGVLREEFGVYDVFDRTKDRKID